MWSLSHKSSGDPAWRLAEVVKISRSGYLSVPLGKEWEVGAERRISVFFDFGTIVILITGLFLWIGKRQTVTETRLPALGHALEEDKAPAAEQS